MRRVCVIFGVQTMRVSNWILVWLVCIATIATTARAGGSEAPPKCNSGPKARWTASDKLASMLEVKGYKVRRIGDMAGCYVVVGTNDKGEEGEFFFHPLTLGQVGRRLR